MGLPFTAKRGGWTIGRPAWPRKPSGENSVPARISARPPGCDLGVDHEPAQDGGTLVCRGSNSLTALSEKTPAVGLDELQILRLGARKYLIKLVLAEPIDPREKPADERAVIGEDRIVAVLI